MKKIQPKLVIFDMDGTMIDTEMVSFAGMVEASKVLGHDTPRDVLERMIGTNAERCRQIIFEHYGTDFDFDKAIDIHNEYVDTYFEKHGIPVKNGLFPLLDKLESLNIKKCVATSTDKKRATYKLSQVDIAHRFEVIVGGDEVKKSKPDPEIFLKAASACGYAPEDCLVIEDSAAGTEGAFKAGMRVIIVPDLGPLTDEIRSMAYALCADLNEVAEMMG